MPASRALAPSEATALAEQRTHRAAGCDIGGKPCPDLAELFCRKRALGPSEQAKEAGIEHLHQAERLPLVLAAERLCQKTLGLKHGFGASERATGNEGGFPPSATNCARQSPPEAVGPWERPAAASNQSQVSITVTD